MAPPFRHPAILLLVVALLALHPWRPCSASVIGIDLGTETFKVVLVHSTGHPDIVLNSASHRNTPVAMAIVANMRSYGEAALALV